MPSYMTYILCPTQPLPIIVGPPPFTRTRFLRRAVATSRKNDGYRTGCQPVIVYYRTTCFIMSATGGIAFWEFSDAALSIVRLVHVMKVCSFCLSSNNKKETTTYLFRFL